MSIINGLKSIGLERRRSEDALYSIVAQEVEQGIRYDGLWIKALEQARGNPERQIAEYIRLRVQKLKDDKESTSNTVFPDYQVAHKYDIEEFVDILSGESSIETVQRYFSNMTTNEIATFINLPDASEEYPLHISISKGRTDFTGWLLAAGANPEMKNYWGKTPLQIAERMKNRESADLIKKYLA